MRIADPFLFLIGDRDAILRIVGSWWSLLVGAIFVVSAGVARNYDHHYFLTEWQWLYGPFVASILSSLFLFVFGCRNFSKSSKWRSYLSFLSLYWMTAPCAWLYGIPVELFADLTTATLFNIGFLLTVSIWRVLLIARCLYVLGGGSFLVSLLRVLCPASVLMCIASLFKGIEMVSIMGGVRMLPNEQLIKTASDATLIATFWIAIISFTVLCAQSSAVTRSAKFPWREVRCPKPILMLAILTTSLWILLSLPFQKQARNNYMLNVLIKEGRHMDAVAYVKERERRDFLPSHYIPPGKSLRNWQTEDLLRVMGDEAHWARTNWLEQIGQTEEEWQTFKLSEKQKESSESIEPFNPE